MTRPALHNTLLRRVRERRRFLQVLAGYAVSADPTVYHGELKLPEATNRLGGKSTILNQSVDGVLRHADVLRDIIRGPALELQPNAKPLIESLTIDNGDSANDLENQSLFYGRELGFDAGRRIETGSLPFFKGKVCIGKNR